jgi:hypothetical protein
MLKLILKIRHDDDYQFRFCQERRGSRRIEKVLSEEGEEDVEAAIEIQALL